MSLWKKFDEFADRATELADKATDRARGLAAEHNDKIDAKLDRAAGFIDEKTGGKYSDRIGTGIGRAKDGLDRFAEHQPGPEHAGPDQPGPDQSGPDQSGPDQSGPQQSGPQQSGPQGGAHQGGPADPSGRS